MRLGQMARKLGVTQAEIIRYLSGQNMSIEESSNVKLEEKHIRSLYAQFAPSESFDVEKQKALARPTSDTPHALPVMDIEGISEDEIPNIPIMPEVHPEVTAEPTIVEEAQTSKPADSVFSAEAETADQTGTIRAPKIELAGLKIVGKIELPETKKKEVTSDEDVPGHEDTAIEGSPAVTVSSKPEDERRSEISPEKEGTKSKERFRVHDATGQDDRRRPRKQPREQRPSKNPIAAQREREMENERERLNQKAAQDKERRTYNYQKRVKHSPPTKAARLVEEPLEQMSDATYVDEPTTWLGKFMKWLRT